MKRILQTRKIRKHEITLCLMTVFLICLWATSSFASWSQGFSENGIYNSQTYNITGIEVFKIDGTSDLEAPGMSNFTAGAWTVDMPNSNYILAINSTPISNFGWDFSFTGTTSDSLHLVYLAYADNGDVFGTDLLYNSGSTGWNYPYIGIVNPEDYNLYRSPSAVPIPPSVFLLGTGLLAFVGLRRKHVA